MFRVIALGFLMFATLPADGSWTSLTDRAPPSTWAGVWSSPSTGHLLNVSAGGITVYHRDGERCVEDTGLAPPASLLRVVASDELQVQAYDFREFEDLMQVPQRFGRSSLGLADCVAVRTDALPVEVFDEVWELFQRRYAFFDVRGVDWQAARARYRPLAQAARTDEELFAVLSLMLGELGDGHVNLSRGDLRFNAGRSGLRDRLDAAWRADGSHGTAAAWRGAWQRESQARVIALLDAGSHRTAADGALEWGRIGSTGYVRVNRFSAFAAGQDRPGQFEALRQGLVRMKHDLASSRQLIVDVALNGGGSDAAAVMVAQVFADEPRETLSYQAGDEPPQSVIVAPVFGPEDRPVVLVTSEVTASAAECFVLMMRTFPHVVHVGEPTRGILSSLLPKPLSNGFMVTLSYQWVLDHRGQSFEGRGIEPQRRLELFPPSDLRGGLAVAIGALAEQS